MLHYQAQYRIIVYYLIYINRNSIKIYFKIFVLTIAIVDAELTEIPFNTPKPCTYAN